MNSVDIDPSTIRDRAYARWQERGCPAGSPEHDWLEAEQELSRALALESRPLQSSKPSAAGARKGALPAPLGVTPSSTDAAKPAKPPRPTLKRAPAARAAKLLNEVTPKPPVETRVQKALAAAAVTKRSAAGGSS
ncbi:MAG TPA: DUF2934 domain-containing protein [Polyangiaceae bacterium]|nr:DUF2934 domain-containing protein [Polyangiaceae bacterium]